MFKLFLGLLLAGLSTSASSVCDWSNPGQDPYIGRPDKAVESFKDIPWMARRTLAQRAGRAAPDDQIDIGKEEIKGSRWTYANEIRNMHFGSEGKICHAISRAGWPEGHTEPAAVWCTKQPFDSTRHCVAQAYVCGNYFQVTQVGQAWRPGPSKPHKVPEPGTLGLVALAGALMVLRRK